jgi:phosphate butyryltransferase
MSVTNFEDILNSAKNSNKKVVIICPYKETILDAVKMAMEENLAEFIFVGDGSKINDVSNKFFSKNEIPTIVDAEDDMDSVMKGCQIIKEKKADTIMKGHISTSTFLKGILNKETGLNIGRFLSHIVVLELPTYHKLLFITDGGMNPHPDLNTKVNILENAINTVVNLGIDKPKIACLAGVETVNENQPETLDASVLVEMNVRGQIQNASVDGPLAMDLAISKESAEIKNIKSEVAGDADIFLVPDMATGNIMAKALIHLGGAKSGGIVVGASAPIILLSRADDAETKMRSIALGIGMAG